MTYTVLGVTLNSDTQYTTGPPHIALNGNFLYCPMLTNILYSKTKFLDTP